MQAGIFYYAREGYYRHLHNAALERLKQFGSDPVLLFWKAYAIIMEGISGRQRCHSRSERLSG